MRMTSWKVRFPCTRREISPFLSLTEVLTGQGQGVFGEVEAHSPGFVENGPVLEMSMLETGTL
jgi:hypothetical protein